MLAMRQFAMHSIPLTESPAVRSGDPEKSTAPRRPPWGFTREPAVARWRDDGGNPRLPVGFGQHQSTWECVRMLGIEDIGLIYLRSRQVQSDA
jgi:hypothetical protein